MDKIYPEEGLYNLEAKDIFAEAQKLFKEFFSEQTPLRAFSLSITLYHLLEWVLPGGNSKSTLTEIEKKSKSTEAIISREEKLVLELRKYDCYEVLSSIANNSKHYKLRSPAYEKKILKGFKIGKSVIGEKIGQSNLTVNFKGKDIWLREVFAFVLGKYAEYFKGEAA